MLPSTMTSDRGKRVLAYHKDKLGERIKARVMSLVISYDFANEKDHIREGNQHDLVKLKAFFSACSDCDFRYTSPSAKDMRNKRTLSADGIKQIFGADEPPTLFFLFILSHGSEQGIILTDTRIGENFDSFSTDDVLMALKDNIFLHNAVKLIFFGPCRGAAEEMCSVPRQGFVTTNEVNEFATRVEVLPEHDNFAIFYSTVESTKAVRRPQHGTVMVDSFVSKLKEIKTDSNIIESFTGITKLITTNHSQMPQFTVFPHLATYFCTWMEEEETHDAYSTGKLINYFTLSDDDNFSLFRRALIFSDGGASNEITTQFDTSLKALGFQVHCNQLDFLTPTLENISRLGMMSDEAWLLIFVFATIKQIAQDGCNEFGIAATAAGSIKPMREIVQLFTGAKCSTFAEKPKIFFFLDANIEAFDSKPTYVHTQLDIKANVNNHSGILICSSADEDFIKRLPSELARMIDERISLQKVVFNLMETGKPRHLTRLWSTAPEEICILKNKVCPMHPELLYEGDTMKIADIAKQVKIQSNRITIVAAASEQEKHAACVELYSQSVIENPVREEMVMYLNTADALNPTEDQKMQRVRIVEGTCKRSAESDVNILVVVEYFGIESSAFLEEFLNFLIRCNGKALVVTAVEIDDCNSVENLVDLQIKVSDLLRNYDQEILEKEREEEMDILDKKNPTTFEGCNYESINLTLRTDIITAVENLPTGACVQELSSTNENILFAKLLSNSMPGLSYFILSDFLRVEIGIRQKWVNRNPDITIVFIVSEDEEISDNINLGVCKWFVLKACAKNTASEITEDFKISILDALSLQALNEHKIDFYGVNTPLSAIVPEKIRIEQKIIELVNLQFSSTETCENLLTTKFFIDRNLFDENNEIIGSVPEFAHKIIKDDQTDIFLISSESGMGKTKFIMELQKRLNEILEDYWIVNLDCSNRLQELKKMNGGKSKMASNHDFESFVLRPWASNSPLQFKILEAKLHSQKVVILLDAFDEIDPEDRNVALNIISIVLDMQLKLVLTTRQELCAHSEDVFKAKSILFFKLGVLAPVQQVDFIAQCWQQKDDTLTDFDECQFKALSILPKTSDAFETIGTPLLLKLLANTVSANQATGDIDVPKDVYDWHLENYYHKLVEIEYKISPDHHRTKAIFQRQLQYVRLIHSKAAICTLLHKGKCDAWQELEISTIVDCGLAVVTDNVIRFHHKSFAEFLLSCALFEFVIKGELSNGITLKVMWQVLIENDFTGVRQFLEQKLSAVVDYTFKETEISLRKDLSYILFSNIICENLPSLYRIFETTLLGVNVNKRIAFDGMFYAPLTLAICFSDKDVVKKIIKKGGKVDELAEKNLKISLFDDFIHKACKKELLNVIKNIIHLFENKLNTEDNVGRTPLSYAIENNNVEMIMTLLEHGARFTFSSKFIHEALEEAWKSDERNKTGWQADCSTENVCHSIMTTGHQSIQIGIYPMKAYISENFTSFDDDIEVEIVCREDCHNKKNLEHKKLLQILSNFLLTNSTKSETDKPTFLKAAEIGHFPVIQYMIRSGQDVNEKCSFLQTALHRAATYKRFSATKIIIDSLKASIHLKDTSGNTPLHCAVLAEATDIVHLLLEKGADVNSENLHKNTPLHFAALNGNCAIITTLLRFGAKVDAKNLSNLTSLAYLVLRGLVCATKTLLAQGADPHAEFENGETCLHYATIYGFLEVVDVLLEYVPVDVRTKDNWTPLHMAVNRDNLEMVHLLLQRGADPMSVNGVGNTCLHLAAFNNNIVLVQLFSLHIPVNSTNSQLKTPLALACCAGNLDTINYLVRIGADLQIVDANGCSCLHRAAGLGQLAVVRALIPKISMELKNKYGWTALLQAAILGELEVVVCLIERGADFSCTTDEGVNGLHIAAGRGHLEVVKVFSLLLPIDQLEHTGWTALMLAVQNGHEDVVKYLLENGADGKIMHPLAGTCLHIAAGNGHLDIVIIFLSHISINCPDFMGQTPLMHAIARGYLQVIQCLLANGADPLIASHMGVTCLHAICGNNDNYMEMLELFVPLIDVNVTAYDGLTPLMAATYEIKVDAIKFLLRAGADVTATDDLKKNCLHIAAEKSNLECVKLFAETENTLINSIAVSGITPIVLACVKGDVAIVQYLLEKGADVSLVYVDGNTLLHTSSHFVEVMQLIVDLIPVDSRNRHGVTPLMIACKCENVDCAKLLLEKGADAKILLPNGTTYLYMVAESGNLDLVMLFSGRLSIDVISDEGNTPLMIATYEGFVKVVKFLTENGADTTLLNILGFSSLAIASYRGLLDCVKVLSSVTPIDFANRDGSTPFMQAAKEGHMEILQFLLIKGANVAALDKDGNTCLHYAVLSRQLALVQFLAYFVPLNHINEVGLTCRDVASLLNQQDIADYLRLQGARRNIRCNTLRDLMENGHNEVIAYVLDRYICKVDDDDFEMTTAIFQMLSDESEVN